MGKENLLKAVGMLTRQSKEGIKITLEVTGRSIEVVSVLLSEAHQRLAEEPRMAKSRGLTVRDVVGIEAFRQRLLTGYFETFEPNKQKGKL
jgi:hypothetical protein